ncbi:MAG: IclR family transcriptional regulator C-terminal domain-containing protein [Pseudomonadota bacterium]
MSCIGAAIFDDQSEPCAGISVSGPTARFGAQEAKHFGKLVAKAAQEVTLAIGGRMPQ